MRAPNLLLGPCEVDHLLCRMLNAQPISASRGGLIQLRSYVVYSTELKMQGCVIALLYVLARASFSVAQGWSVMTLPDPRSNPLACDRDVEGWVCSPDGLVGTDTLCMTQGYISSIYAGTDPYSELVCPDSGEVVTVEVMAFIIQRVQGTGDAATKVSDFTTGVHNRFGVGSSTCGSGAVIVISVEDRQVYISTGEAVGDILDEVQIEAIVQSIGPQLRSGDYGSALMDAVTMVGLTLSSKDKAPDYDYATPDYDHDGQADYNDGPDYDYDSSPDLWLVSSWLLITVGVPLMISVCKCTVAAQQRASMPARRAAAAAQHRRSYPAQQEARTVAEKLQKMQRDIQAAKVGRYVASSCPICLEDFASDASGPTSTAAAATAAAATAGCPAAHAAGFKTAANGWYWDGANEVEEPLLCTHAADADTCMHASYACGPPIDEADLGVAAAPGPPTADGDSDVGNGSCLTSAGAEGATAAVSEVQAPLGRKPERRKPERRPFMLPCGHIFCKPCITEWLQLHKECPVCRTPVEEGLSAVAEASLALAADGTSSAAGSDAASGPTATPISLDQYDQYEFEFRLARMLQSFPHSMSPHTASSLLSDVYGRSTPCYHPMGPPCMAHMHAAPAWPSHAHSPCHRQQQWNAWQAAAGGCWPGSAVGPGGPGWPNAPGSNARLWGAGGPPSPPWPGAPGWPGSHGWQGGPGWPGSPVYQAPDVPSRQGRHGREQHGHRFGRHGSGRQHSPHASRNFGFGAAFASQQSDSVRSSMLDAGSSAMSGPSGGGSASGGGGGGW
eukprot:jgi/Ulvmu1/900/UM101_0008.1